MLYQLIPLFVPIVLQDDPCAAPALAWSARACVAQPIVELHCVASIHTTQGTLHSILILTEYIIHTNTLSLSPLNLKLIFDTNI